MSKETTEFVFEKMEQYFDAAKHVIEQYGGDVAELWLGALRIQAASEVLLPFIFTVIFSVGMYKIYKYFATEPLKPSGPLPEWANDEAIVRLIAKGFSNRSHREDERVEKETGEKTQHLNSAYLSQFSLSASKNLDLIFEEAEPTLMFFGGVICAIVLILSVVELVNIWAWIGIFYPELYAVHQFILR